MWKVREISRGGGSAGAETEACSLVGNLGSDRQPVKSIINKIFTWKYYLSEVRLKQR